MARMMKKHFPDEKKKKHQEAVHGQGQQQEGYSQQQGGFGQQQENYGQQQGSFGQLIQQMQE